MLTLIQTSIFTDWFNNLPDEAVQVRILGRLKRAAFGNFGDCEPVGEGVSEMRIHTGAGYRLYYVRTDSVVYVLLCGGNKSTQKRDILMAKKLSRELKRGET